MRRSSKAISPYIAIPSTASATRPADDGPLPKLPDVYCGIYIRSASDRVDLEQLGEFLAETLHPTRRLSMSDPKHAAAASSF